MGVVSSCCTYLQIEACTFVFSSYIISIYDLFTCCGCPNRGLQAGRSFRQLFRHKIVMPRTWVSRQMELTDIYIFKAP